MTGTDHTCHECGARLSLRQHVEQTHVGRYKVDDASQRVPVCANGHAELDLGQLAEYARRAAVVVLSEVGEFGGGEFRDARKALGLSQAELGKRMGVRQETISRWETGEQPIDRTTRLALLAIERDPASLERLDDAPADERETLHVPVRAA